MPNTELPLVLTPTETAKILRIGRGTVYEQIRLGLIPHIRIGKKILIPRAALMKMLEEAEHAVGPVVPLSHRNYNER